MTRIIFVDDEPRVLDGIRRLLYHLGTEWQISFAASGSEALEIMDREPFDMIVTDVRMPRTIWVWRAVCQYGEP